MRRKWTYEIGLGYESILRDGVMVNKEQAVRALNNYESRIAELRTCNDAISLDHDQTLLLRGRIAELKSILSLPTKDQPLTDE